MPMARPRCAGSLLSPMTANSVGSMSTTAQASMVPTPMIGSSVRSAG